MILVVSSASGYSYTMACPPIQELERTYLSPLKVFTDYSKAVLLMWIPFVIYVSRLSLFYCLVCSLKPYDYMLRKDWPLGSLLCIVFLCFRHTHIRCPGSGVVLDCIHS